ncbi:S1C family serine protease [Candidatus Formimonas warabiya]|uniref:PDZ domain-containing protein n=1 Tax=Formimonas warabiya TaxID=1761012 RepID=A0A3G1KQA6_FORW1|nr:trypsin-like peptidase domain-containing protein [Candidatus Formimonas warabiya]ATW24626.1 hypothetical protein DCMF_07375 [Candidatus Formimonas warabiya]
MKKLLIGVVTVFLLAGITRAADAAGPIHVEVNGDKAASPAQEINGKLYVSVDTLTDALGVKAYYDEKEAVLSLSTMNQDDLIPEILKNVSPSVVGVIGRLKDDATYSAKFKDLIAHGTGVIIKSNGEILTNAHVVKDMERIVVVLADGTGYEATLKCIDEECDLALLKIEKSGLTVAKFGKQEEIINGRTVIAIGTPVSFSLRNSASLGVISGVNRAIESDYRLIQTDAAINPGNSGGPLVNMKGEIIGINSSKFAGTGIEGLGFSIPVDTINYVLDHFTKYGKVRRPSLGAEFEEDWAATVGLPTINGLTVTSVEQKNGLAENDILYAVDDIPVNSLVDLNEAMKKYLPGDTVQLKIKRGSAVQSLNVKLGEKNSDK